MQNEKSVAAASAAISAHANALGIEGDPSIQLWHLIASLSEWAAVNGISVEAELREFQETLDGGELDLPAAEAARKVMLQKLRCMDVARQGLQVDVKAMASSVQTPAGEVANG